MRQNCLVKITGDMLDEYGLFAIEQLTQRLNTQFFVVLCIGGGTQITQELAKAGLDKGTFGPLGREINSFEGRQLARDVLERNQAQLQDHLASEGIHVSVVVPVLDVGTVLCHINGDQFVLAAYHGFDAVYILTKRERMEEKKKFFAPYQKVNVLGYAEDAATAEDMILR